MMANLASRHCTPVKKGTKPISADVAKSLLNTLRPGWSINEDAQAIEREFIFKGFNEATGFVNAIAWIANTENHQPDLEIRENRCKVIFFTRSVGGLTVNDFICAAKIDALLKLEQTPKRTTNKKSKTADPIVIPNTITTENPKTDYSDDNVGLDVSEAEALLNAEEPEPDLTSEFSTEEEDELELFDPDEERTQTISETDNKATNTQEHKPSIQEKLANSTLEGPEIDVMSTVILPPDTDTGTYNTGILEPEEEDDILNIDLSSTMISAPETETTDHKQPQDFNEVATVILPPQSNPNQNQELHSENDPDEVKTMALEPNQINTATSQSTPEDDERYMRTIAMPPVIIDDK